MRVRYKLILALAIIVSLAIVPISLYLIETLEKSLMEKARQGGRAQSEFFARSVFNLLLTNGGNLKATRVDARDTVKIFETLQEQGLVFLQAAFISKLPHLHGTVLVRWPDKLVERVPLTDNLPAYTIEPCSPGLKATADAPCMVFHATAGLENQAPSILVRMEFAAHKILEPVRRLRQSLLVAMLFALLLVFLTGSLINLRIMKPLHLLEKATAELAAGNLDYRVGLTRRDEFGQLAQSFNYMSAALKKYIAELEEKYRELNAARSIQMALLPEALPQHKQIDFAAQFVPMAEVGGDLYDVFATPNGFAIWVADVSGHGVPAALITGMAKMVITGRPELLEKPSQVLHHLNQTLVGQTGGRFLTLVYAFLSFEEKKLWFANGGHPDLMVVDRNSGSIESYNVKGTMVGVFYDQQYQVRELEVRSGQRIIFLTDGILECTAPDGTMYEDFRWSQFLRETMACNANEFCRLLLQDLETFRKNSPALDDATVVVVDIL